MTRTRKPAAAVAEETRWVPIADLKPYPKNSRRHPPEQILQLRASIQEFGWVKPALVLPDLTIIAGHGIWEAARAEGLEQAKVTVITGLTDQQVRAYVIADNKLALNSEWDPELLRLELVALHDVGVPAKFMGFSDKDIRGLIAQCTPGKGEGRGRPRKEMGDLERFACDLTPLEHGLLKTALAKVMADQALATPAAALMAIVEMHQRNEDG